MIRTLVAVTLSLVGLTTIIAGCESGDASGVTGPEAPIREGDGGPEADATSKSCEPAALPPCSPACGGARCLPADSVPSATREIFATCGGGYCVPESLIVAGTTKPASCKSVGGMDGVCVNMCIPQIAQNKDAIPQSTCAADERCAPCINPLNNQPTGLCDFVPQNPETTCRGDAGATQPGAPSDGGQAPTCPHTGPPVIEPASLPPCGDANSGAHCVPETVVPPDQGASLAKCPGGYCVPDKLIASGGDFIPATCTAIGGAEGRCESIVFPDIAAHPDLPKSTCDANERCVPCFDPVSGKDTGACRTSCDPGPTKPPVLFADCCKENGTTRGKCVPASTIPASDQESLSQDTCAARDRCVPTEMAQDGFVPKKCKGEILFDSYDGVCLSNCLDFGFLGDIVLDQGDCDALHTCAPCEMFGKPTGAPGCP